MLFFAWAGTPHLPLDDHLARKVSSVPKDHVKEASLLLPFFRVLLVQEKLALDNPPSTGSNHLSSVDVCGGGGGGGISAQSFWGYKREGAPTRSAQEVIA